LISPLLSVGGYVLAGGLSSRMGQEKALLELAGKPLIAHAVEKLRRFCADVSILTNNEVLGRFAPTVPDLHPGCGPMSGMEAALVQSPHDWNLIFPVDVPFLPTLLLETWCIATLADGQAKGTRIAMFEEGGIPQPALLMIHRDMTPYLQTALTRGEFKLGPALHLGAASIAVDRDLNPAAVLRKRSRGSECDLPATGIGWHALTEAQKCHRQLWFANLNTPEDFANAAQFVNVLDT
jgi:molybdopterin-guanine dinucleotide biosynthesis protein A